MNIRRVLSVAALAVGTVVTGVGCSAPAPTVESVFQVQQVAEQQPVITASNEVRISFPRSEVSTIAAPPQAVETPDPGTPPAYENGTPQAAQPVQQTVNNNPVSSTPNPAPAVVSAPVAQSPVPVAEAAPAIREVYVGLAGGQNIVDLGRGPVLFPLNGAFPPYVAEHDLDGGWARFGTLSAGMKVRMSGLVTGTYTVGQIINVPKGGSTDELRRFSVMPKVMLQTCVPGTSRMIVVGLY